MTEQERVDQERERARRVAALGPMRDSELARRIVAESAPVAPAGEGDTAVSDAVSSGAGGRSASLTGRGDLPHISPSGPAPPSVDRERARRDASRYAHDAEVTILALLAELEQAERERDDALHGRTLARADTENERRLLAAAEQRAGAVVDQALSKAAG